MEEICKNCEYFVQESFGSEAYVWGRCRKPTGSVEVEGKKESGAFMWADKTCSDFKPKQKSE